jgi:hypothetical protein
MTTLTHEPKLAAIHVALDFEALLRVEIRSCRFGVSLPEQPVPSAVFIPFQVLPLPTLLLGYPRAPFMTLPGGSSLSRWPPSAVFNVSSVNRVE